MTSFADFLHPYKDVCKSSKAIFSVHHSGFTTSKTLASDTTANTWCVSVFSLSLTVHCNIAEPSVAISTYKVLRKPDRFQ